MKGDVVLVESYHKKAGDFIASHLFDEINHSTSRYIITISGESGSGKSETAQALADALKQRGFKSVILGQDDYFRLPPRSNDAKRRQDSEWLGPHAEVKLDVLDNNLKDAIDGMDHITKPLVDYDANSITTEKMDLSGVKVVIAEGTYTSLLKHVDKRAFITRNRLQTLEHRRNRNRGDEANDPFIENVLKIEHMIIAGHKQLADFVIDSDYNIVQVK